MGKLDVQLSDVERKGVSSGLSPNTECRHLMFVFTTYDNF